MGGSGSSGGWQPTVHTDICSSLNFKTTINSPQPSALSVIKIGDLLSVVLGGGATPRIEVHYQGSAVGAITGSAAARLLQCMQSGHPYEAEVLQIAGGKCDLLVRHA